MDRALHGRKGISEATRNRILQIAKDHGYRPNAAARALKVGSEQLRIGVCIPQSVNGYFDQLKQGIEAEAEELSDFGVTLFFSTRETLETDPTSQIVSVLGQGAQILILCPSDSKTMLPIIKQTEERGIPVICVSSDVPDSQRSTVVWVDPVVSGRMAGELMAKLLHVKKDVAIVTGSLDIESHHRKVEAFREEFERRQTENRVIEVIEGHDNVAITFQKVWKYLEQSTSLGGIYVSTGNFLPVCNAVSAANLNGEVTLITTDLYPEMIPYFEQQIITASLYQGPSRLGSEALKLAVDHLINRTPLQPYYSSSPQIVLSANLKLFREVAPNL